MTPLNKVWQRRLYVEILEDRTVPATLFVNAAFSGAETGSATNPFNTIQEAITAAASGDTIQVSAGTYNENLTINKNLSLLSTAGKDATVINGTQLGATLGTIVVTANTTGVRIGDVNFGFTINGIDGPSAGLESAALYFQGGHTNVTIQGNKIVANGDEALLTEFGSTYDNWIIDRNEFAGQTFIGTNPGVGNQFTVPNVPRALVFIGTSSSDVATDFVFSNNLITGTAGGFTAGGVPSGNQLVNLDVKGVTITGNTFAGATTGFAASLRARRSDITIANNTFISDELTATNPQIVVNIANVPANFFDQVIATNSFDRPLLVIGNNIGIAPDIVVRAPAAAAMNVPYTVTVEAQNPDGTIFTGFTGTVTLAGSPGLVGVPASLTFVAGDNGVKTFQVTPTSAGPATVTATLSANAAETGVSTTNVVGPVPRSATVVAPLTNQSPFRVLNPDGSVRFSLFAFDPGFQGGVRVATGDVTGDGIEDVVVGAGAGGGPHIKVFDGVTGAVVRSFFAFASNFSGGVTVAVGDVNRDGFGDIIVGAGAGGAPHVKVFSGANLAELQSFYAYAVNYTGGVTVASGDTNGDGFSEIITAAGLGSSHVRVFNGVNAAELASFFAFNSTINGSLSLAAGDVDGDNQAEIFASINAPGTTPEVRLFNGNGTLRRAFLAFAPGYVGGVRVGIGDVNGDGRGDLLAISGAGTLGHLRGFDGVTFAELASFFADPVSQSGLSIG